MLPEATQSAGIVGKKKHKMKQMIQPERESGEFIPAKHHKTRKSYDSGQVVIEAENSYEKRKPKKKAAKTKA